MIQEPSFVKDVITLSSEWNASLNIGIDSGSVKLGSSKKVWWTCPEGHNYQAIVANRSKGSGCSVCNGKTVLKGFNDIATTDPTLAAEISQTRNESGLQYGIARGSNTKIWWICHMGHEWETTPNNRRGGKSGCPFCSNRKVSSGVNDLRTTRPALAKEFDSLKNSPKTANEVPSNSNAPYWWLCEAGHSWKATLGNRVKGQGCPYCSGRKSIPGSTDLETTNPELAAQWHPNLNGALTPAQFKGRSHKKVWWLCEKGHSFQAHIDERARGNGCSVCAGYTIVAGINDLATTYPELAATLHVGDGQSVDASTIYAGSHQKLLWECSRGHVWTAAVFKRASGQGCSVCSNQKLLQGFNDLATTNPALSAEFDLVKNSPQTPADVIAGTNKQLWWVCELGHSWRTSGSHRVMGRGCPTCAVTGFNPSMPGLLYFIENKSMLAKKIGITNVEAKTDRLKAFKSAGWVTIATFVSEDGKKISDAETLLLRWIRKELGLPQFLDASSMKGTGGASETFSGELSDDQVLAKIREVISGLKVEIRS